jgi:hypothetical protein
MRAFKRWREKREKKRRRKTHAKIVNIRVQSNSDFSTGRAQVVDKLASAPEVGAFLLEVLRPEREGEQIETGVQEPGFWHKGRYWTRPELDEQKERIACCVSEIIERSRREWAAMSAEEQQRWLDDHRD